jgi:hypothetical protein
MAVSSGFLDSFDKLVIFSDLPCVCNIIHTTCRSCLSKERLEELYYKISSAIDEIENIPEGK